MMQTRYNKHTGRLLGHCAGLDPEHLPQDEALIDGEIDTENYYFRDGVLTQLDDLTLEIVGQTIRGLPKDTVIRHDGVVHVVSGEWKGHGFVTVEAQGYRLQHIWLKNYVEQRAEAYPEIGQQLDAIYKMVDALNKSGTELPPETKAWLTEIKAVKEQFPKT